MADPAIREKAKELFVQNGFSMDTILTMLDGEVSRKTLYNYRKEDKWDELRKNIVARKQNRRERLEALLDRYIEQAEVNLNPGTLFAIGKLITALKSANYIDFTDEIAERDENNKKGLSKENLEKIEKELLNL
jgi:DNA-binding transcriptional MocR family regulator